MEIAANISLAEVWKRMAESPDALPMASMAERLYEHAAAVEGENKDFGVVYRAVYGGAGVVQTSE